LTIHETDFDANGEKGILFRLLTAIWREITFFQKESHWAIPYNTLHALSIGFDANLHVD